MNNYFGIQAFSPRKDAADSPKFWSEPKQKVDDEIKIEQEREEAEEQAEEEVEKEEELVHKPQLMTVLCHMMQDHIVFTESQPKRDPLVHKCKLCHHEFHIQHGHPDCWVRKTIIENTKSEA